MDLQWTWIAGATALALIVGVAGLVLARDDDSSGITVAGPDASSTTTATPPCDGTRTDVEATLLPELHDARSDRTFTGQPGPDELPPGVVQAWKEIVAAAARCDLEGLRPTMAEPFTVGREALSVDDAIDALRTLHASGLAPFAWILETVTSRWHWELAANDSRLVVWEWEDCPRGARLECATLRTVIDAETGAWLAHGAPAS